MDISIESTQGFRATHSTWHQQLEAAFHSDQILGVAQDYLATFGPEHLARLPADCRPGRVKAEDDIAYWSCKLAQHRHQDPVMRIDAGLMQEMLNFFLHAWVRLSQIHRVPAQRAQVH